MTDTTDTHNITLRERESLYFRGEKKATPSELGKDAEAHMHEDLCNTTGEDEGPGI
jgi:hypothetical protein